MYNKDNMGEMDEEKKAEWTEKLTGLGVPEEIIDEPLIWTVKKASFKLSKLRLILDEKGVEESKAKEIIQTLVTKALGKDLAKIKEWQEKHKEK
ncbi:MAG TPA: hypothetical protein VMQ52_03870 [Candidatus Saccharimonadales bacterium]|jgi:endonuclease III-like uncharacterized protein|nr:hypothetical protein [Candidatus Saccharimonadales bacterium]